MQQPKTDDLMAKKQCRQQMTQLMNDNANTAKNDLSIKAADDNGQALLRRLIITVSVPKSTGIIIKKVPARLRL